MIKVCGTMQEIKKKIVDFSREIGIDAIGFMRADSPLKIEDYLKEHQNKGHATGWEGADTAQRVRPDVHLENARTIIVIAINYNKPEKVIDPINQNLRGRIAKASWGMDYHNLLHKKLSLLDDFILDTIDSSAKNIAFVDTGPLVDREVAVQAGIGFYGYHCNVIHPVMGSFIFLGSLLTTVDIEVDEVSRENTCKGCRRCISACPTQAIYAPYRIDSSRCLAYLTLTKGEHGHSYQGQLTNQIYGCDICQCVCPHNQGAPISCHPELEEIEEIQYPNLIELLTISNKEFKNKFGHTSGVWRGKKPWQRNALLLIGKRKLTEAIPVVEAMSRLDEREDMKELAKIVLKQLQEDTNLWLKQ